MSSFAFEEILEASRCGDVKALQVALRVLGYSVVDVVDQEGMTPLHIACSSGNLTAVRLLLAAATIPAKAICTPKVETTSLEYNSGECSTVPNTDTSSAAERANECNLSYKTSSDPKTTSSIPYSSSSSQISAKSCAMEASSRESTRSSSTAHVYKPINEKLCPSCLVETSSDKTSAKCMKCGNFFRDTTSSTESVCPPATSQWASSTTKKGHTALHWAALKGYDSIVKELLAAGFDVNAQSKRGATPLYLAAVKRHLTVISTLMEAGADASVKTQDGVSVLSLAEHSSGEELRELIAKVNRRKDDCQVY